MGVQTLEQLKEENASKAAETEEAALQSRESEDEVVDEAELENEEELEDAGSGEDSDEGDVELWMQGDEQTSQDRKFTDSDVAVVRRKLKARVTKVEDENAELKAQLEKLQNSQPKATPLTRPRLEDFDHDEDAYNKALDDYYEAKVDQRLNSYSQSNARTRPLVCSSGKQNRRSSRYDNAPARG